MTRLGGLGDRREDAADAAGLVADRTIGKGEVALLGVAVALEEEEQVVRPGGVAARRARPRAWGR